MGLSWDKVDLFLDTPGTETGPKYACLYALYFLPECRRLWPFSGLGILVSFQLVSFQTPGCHNIPKFLKTCFEVLETSGRHFFPTTLCVK